MICQYHSIYYSRYIAIILALCILLPIGSNVQASWCSGSRWLFFKMPVKRRVAKASSAVTSELKLVESNVQALTDDIKRHHGELEKALDQEQQLLTHKAQTQCQAPTADPAEQLSRRNQLRLDLATLNAMQEVRQRLSQQFQEQATLIQDLEAQRYELQHLQQRLAKLIAAAPPLLETDLTLRSTCTATNNSRALRSRYHPLSRAVIDQQVLRIRDLLSKIPESTVVQALETCDLAQALSSLTTQEQQGWKYW